MAGSNVFSAGQGNVTGTNGWSPTILYLFVLILIEMVIFGLLSKRV